MRHKNVDEGGVVTRHYTNVTRTRWLGFFLKKTHTVRILDDDDKWQIIMILKPVLKRNNKRECNNIS